MAISVPQMQTAYTGYDFGQNTARNLLDAVRMRNQRDMQERKLKSDYELQQRRLRSAEGMQKERLDQNQTQFDDDLTFRETGQDASIKSQLELDAIRRAQEARAKKSYDVTTATTKAISDQEKLNLLNEQNVDEAQKRFNQTQTGGGSFLNQLATGAYNFLQPLYEGVDNLTLGLIDGNLGTPEERGARDSGLNTAVNAANNQSYNIYKDTNPDIVLPTPYIQQTRQQDPDNFLNRTMLNRNY
mgnify:FL=1|tara:strand:- start:1790 stop:2518 length:729 start_codon:yes stop_codon:yes gene_type:complete